MKIYFEELGYDSTATYLTPMKLYEVVGVVAGGGVARINDDDGEEIDVGFIDDYHTRSSWKIIPEETKTQSASDIVASLESECNALANSIDSVNELLDSLSVPRAETLVERVKSALTDKRDAAGTTEARIVSRSPRSNLVRVAMRTESGEIVRFDAFAHNDSPKYNPAWPAASSKEGE